ncbi:MAG: hypothetical protein HY234_01510 [Acidobacteria bacterium]|nr:hypothetical protein [Acidobacteriota bacterium]
MSNLERVEESTAAPVRRSERVRTRVPVTLIWHEDQHRRYEASHTVSVSRFGCLVRSRYNLQPGTTVLIEHGDKFLLGKISYCLKDYATKVVELGIGFEEDGTEFWGMQFTA